MIAVRGLVKKYDDKEILKGLDLQVAKGEALAIIGPSGAGKTTLLRLVNLLERPTSGTVYFDGRDTDAPERVRLEMRRRMSFVFQKPTVFNASVYDNVAYGLKIRGGKATPLPEKVTQALERVGLSGYETRKARTLSGGEMQRVALARSIVTEPEVLLLDEPTANLDPVSAAKIEELLFRLIRELDTTVIMATHDFSQGQRLAGRIAVLLDGQILQAGDPREVFYLPQDRLVAEFVGVENILEGIITSNEEGVAILEIAGRKVEGLSLLHPGEEACACIRPEEITIALAKTPTSARNSFLGTITRLSSFGALVRVEIDCGFPLVALITRRSAEELGLHPGKAVHASFKATGVHLLRKS